ncbi:hypothetical protein BP5796_00366 [Coleophoma crateriformis]|uniref:GTP-binding protein 8 n=1 Tax=Coleophoma crateriformis TaxID=565419 RepID=A0A3D8T7Q0_9HELO|nr:hypothetical protein BP5796_00366 [Coleophoma crateriformis]
MSVFLQLQPSTRSGLRRSVRSSKSFFHNHQFSSASVSSRPSTLKASSLDASVLSYHWDTLPPTVGQLKHASHFFTKKPPAFLWSAEKFKAMAFGDSPEVCFLGRSNVGKSSLLNALLGDKIAHTSSKPGRTRLMNAFAVGGAEDNGKNRLVVLDMPGYGKGGRAEWGLQILKYLEKRKQLTMAFLLVDSEHGVKESDKQLLAMFREKGVPFQVVLSKVDRVLFEGSRSLSDNAMQYRLSNLRRTMESVQAVVQPDTEDEAGGVGEVIACSSEKRVDGDLLGINAVRFAMLRAAKLERKPKMKEAKPVEIVSFDDLYSRMKPTG